MSVGLVVCAVEVQSLEDRGIAEAEEIKAT
jgi:hypothetical protein